MLPVRGNTLLGWLAAATVLGLACQTGPSEEVQRQLNELASISAERDSLFGEVVENARLLNQISEELEDVEGGTTVAATGAESPILAARENLLTKVQEVTARLEASERRLASNRARLGALGRENDSLKTRVAELEQAVAGFAEVVESQRTTIAALTEQVTALAQETVALRDTISDMEKRENLVYYIVGTKDELIERGIIVKEGGARFLFIFGKRGETLRPATNLDPSQFVAIDRMTMTEIPLPDPEREYRIASRQNLAYLEEPPNENGKVKGAVRIASPKAFWMPSKFLILVQG